MSKMGNNFPTYGTITNHQQIQNKLEHAQDLKVRNIIHLCSVSTTNLRHGSQRLDVHRLNGVRATGEEAVGKQAIAFLRGVERVPEEVRCSVRARLHSWKARDGSVERA
jgi:hypothetical protein